MRLTPLLLLGVLACSSTSEPPGGGNPVDCDGQPVLSLAPGEAALISVGQSGGCARIGSTAGAAEYLVLAFSANGTEQPGGAQGDFDLYVGPDSFTPASALRRSPATAFSLPLRFHDRLRRRERELAAHAPGSMPAIRSSAPVTLGDQRVFQVCADLDCATFTPVTATARYVGAHGAVFLDDTVPAGGYAQPDLDSVGTLFDQYLYPIDTTAFGRESDVDGNGQVLILLTDQVNRLSGTCGTGDVVAGYFTGQDLLSQPGSNQAEIFYGLVPDPASSNCVVDLARARRLLAPVLIHEFQHMISYNRHVLLGGAAAEETWLNEGLSQFAEELGGRQVASAWCVNHNCVNQFIKSDITNAYQYLQAPELYHLIEPGESSGSLAERGANWLFVRWLAEQAAGDSARGTAVTRRLVGADNPGGIAIAGEANVGAAAAAEILPGISFQQLLSEWHAANYLEGRNDVPAVSRLSYRSWNLTAAFDQLVLGPYPLRPDSTTGRYHGFGTLRGGSGRLVRVKLGAGDGPITVAVTADQLSLVKPRLSVRRIR